MPRSLYLRYGRIAQFCLRKNQRYSFHDYSIKLNALKYIQELKDAFFAEVGQNKPALSDNPAENNSPIPKVVTTSTKGKGKLRLKKKTADDPFTSDNDAHEEDTNGTSKDSTTELKRPNNDEDEEGGKSKKKKVI